MADLRLEHIQKKYPNGHQGIGYCPPVIQLFRSLIEYLNMIYIGNITITIDAIINANHISFSMLHFFFINIPPYTLTKRFFVIFKSQFKNKVKKTIKIINITPIAAAIPGLFNCTKYFSINTPMIGYDGAKI